MNIILSFFNDNNYYYAVIKKKAKNKGAEKKMCKFAETNLNSGIWLRACAVDQRYLEKKREGKEQLDGIKNTAREVLRDFCDLIVIFLVVP